MRLISGNMHTLDRPDGRHKRKALKTPATSLFALCVVLLLGLVFCWGSQDKVSLYAHGHSVAKAKLLTERERPVAGVAPAKVQPPSPAAPLAFLLFAALCGVFFSLCPRARVIRSGSLKLQAPPLSEALRRRPPPVLA